MPRFGMAKVWFHQELKAIHGHTAGQRKEQGRFNLEAEQPEKAGLVALTGIEPVFED
jgi:hypothetical protein